MTNVTANIVLLAAFLVSPLQAQSEKSDDAVSLMLQWRSIADSVLVKCPQDTKSEIVLAVESEKDKSLIENAFLESFAREGRRMLLTGGAAPAEGQVLRISGIMRLDPPSSEVLCDARWEGMDGARYLGHFRSIALKGESGSGSALERFVEPLIVIAGAVLIVYLFFTVRS